MSYTQEKQLVRAFHQAVLTDSKSACDQYFGDDVIWRGFHPFNILKKGQIADTFWAPLQASFTSMQVREDIFFAGHNEIDGFKSVWVVSMGHLMGLFDQPWLGIKPTNKIAMLRYCEFSRVEGDKIVEQAMYFDIPHFMAQAGQNPFPTGTAEQLVQPGPMGGRGVLLEDAPDAEGKKTLAAINAMISDLGQWDHPLSLEEELRLTWNEDMIWWGPTGIGATYTIPRYAKQHSGPFRETFADRSKTKHIARLAEGAFGGFFGWPNFTARTTKPFIGLEPTGDQVEFRVIDIYRRDGDKLAENWIFIDMLHFAKQMGRDVLGELE